MTKEGRIALLDVEARLLRAQEDQGEAASLGEPRAWITLGRRVFTAGLCFHTLKKSVFISHPEQLAGYRRHAQISALNSRPTTDELLPELKSSDEERALFLGELLNIEVICAHATAH